MPATSKKKPSSKKTGDEYAMLDPGTYAGAVIKAEHVVSGNGNPMIKTCVLVPHPDIGSEDVTFVHDNIMLIPSCAWRLPAISAAIGCPPEKLLESMKGTVVSIEVGVEDDKDYGPSNTIDKWHPATEEQKEAFASRDSGGGGGGGRVSTKEGNEALDAILGSVPSSSKDTMSADDIPF
jgi:hypothetical protein